MNTTEPPPADGLALDLSSAISDAEKQVEAYIDSDPVYAELMATYAELGGILQDHRHVNRDTAKTLPPDVVRRFEQDCQALMGRLIALGEHIDLQAEQEWARWRLHNMNMDGIA